MNELLISLSFLCPPVNAELLDSSGECIALCVEGKAMECLTGPYDHFRLIKVDTIINGSNSLSDKHPVIAFPEHGEGRKIEYSLNQT